MLYLVGFFVLFYFFSFAGGFFIATCVLFCFVWYFRRKINVKSKSSKMNF